MKKSRTAVAALAATVLTLTLAACGGSDDGGDASDAGGSTESAGSTESPDETTETPDETPAETPPAETPEETAPGDDAEGGAGQASGDYCALIADADATYGVIAMEDVTDADAQGMADALAAIRDAAPSELTDDWNVMYVLMQAAADEADPNTIEPGIMDNYESASTNVETSIAQDCGLEP